MPYATNTTDATNALTVHIRVRYTGWAMFVLRVAARLCRLPGGKRLARLVFGACAFQMRCYGKVVATPWRWVRVPFPTIESEQA